MRRSIKGVRHSKAPSKRVEAWIYAVVNPVIDSLKRELELLKAGNLSWRPRIKGCEYILPIRRYVAGGYSPIYQDFLADNRSFEKKFAGHDSALANAEETAGKIFEKLVSNPDFLSEVKKAIQRYESSVDQTQPQRPSFQRFENQIPTDVAEYLINKVDSLPMHYLTYLFWQENGRNFRAFDPWQGNTALPRASTQLANLSRELTNDLESHRLSLCREYDVPAAPIQPIQDALADIYSS
ncbi:MAG: hypothetical protein ACLP6G_17240 [Terriglobales bacterium]